MGLRRWHMALIGLGLVAVLLAGLWIWDNPPSRLYFPATAHLQVSRDGLVLTVPCPSSVTGTVYLWPDLAVELLRVVADGEELRPQEAYAICMDMYMHGEKAVTSSVPPIYCLGGSSMGDFYQLESHDYPASTRVDLFYVWKRFRRLDITYSIRVPPDRRPVWTQSVTFVRKPLGIREATLLGRSAREYIRGDEW